jgi:hypothetical protein
MTEHTVVSDHEHLASDGCQTVEHGDHLDHVHGTERHPEQAVHPDHEGQHTDGDGCETVGHGDHVDHLHDGHRHHQHGEHVDEH